MRGEISLTSTEGIGSTFTCLIPFKSVNLLNKALNYGPVSETLISIDDKPALKHPIIDDTKNFSDIKILLVEDNAIAARTTEAILHSLGCKIDIAKTGGEALMLLKNHHYSFIYMDLGLPDMSGMEVSKIFRAQEGARSPKTPIIALSAHSNEEIKASCLRAGMNESISKPLLREQAKKNIQHYLNANELICPPSSKENLSANLKVIDLDLGAAILGADHNAAKTTLAMIMEQLPESHRIITLAYLQKNTDQLIKATHQLHGGLLYGGAVRLEKATAALEAAARLDDATTLSGCYAQYCNEILYLNEAYGKI